MGKSLTRKIIESHFVSGSMVPGEEVFIHVDQTLTHGIDRGTRWRSSAFRTGSLPGR